MRVITPDEATRQTIEVDRYLSVVSQEVAASKLSPAEKAGFRVFYDGYRANVQEVVNMSWLSLAASSASISDRAESARDQGREWSERARKAGAPNLSGKGPHVPGEGAPEIGTIAKWIGWGLVGLLALEVARTVRATAEAD